MALDGALWRVAHGTDVRMLSGGIAIRKGKAVSTDCYLNAALKIERGIPLPGKNARTWGLAGILRKMQPEDSVLVPDGDSGNVCRTASRLGRLLKVKFITRKVEGGVRIWRVS